MAMEPDVESQESPSTEVEKWCTLSPNERMERARQMLAHGNRQELANLLAAYMILHARGGRQVRAHTQTAYRRGLQRFLDWCARQEMPPAQVDRKMALRYRDDLLAQSLTPASVNLMLTSARTFMRALAWCDLVTGNPFDQVRVENHASSEEKALPYTTDEVDALLRGTAYCDDQAMILLASDAGLRVSEVAALAWSDVDLEARYITVREGVANRADRVRVTPRLLNALQILRGVLESEWLFPGYRGRHVSPRRLQQRLRVLCRDAGVPHRGFHGLRHSCGAETFRRTRDLHVTARHLRHSSVETARVYAQLTDDDYAAAIDRTGV